MEDITRDIRYFGHCGEINTDAVLQFAKERSALSGIQKVVIASETGRSVLSR